MNFLKNKWTAKFVALLLTFIEKFYIKKLPEEIKAGVLIAFQPAKASINALVDQDPDDKAQLTKIWRDFLSKDEPWDYGENKLRELILLKLDNTVYKELMLPILPVLINSFQALTDDVEGNKEQLEALFTEFMDSEEFEEFVRSLLRAFLKGKVDDSDIESILELIESFIKTD